MPALRQYDGNLHRRLTPATSAILNRHALIISGGYGLVRADEPIGYYEAVFKLSQWPQDLVSRCIAAYAQAHHLTTVVALAASTTGYATAIRRVKWPPSVSDAWLLTPRVEGGGAMVRGPAGLGQAVLALIADGSLDSSWRATDGTTLAATPLT